MKKPFHEAMRLIDEANAADPRGEEILYSERMTARLGSYAPDASHHLKLAARAQHICRWMIPYSSFEQSRKGYLQWRNRMREFHADKAGEIMQRAGARDECIEKVQALVSQKNYPEDPESRILEDVVCLVFLEHYFPDFSKNYKNDEEKLLNIIRRTWKKMTPRAHETAMEIPFSDEDRKLIETALSD